MERVVIKWAIHNFWYDKICKIYKFFNQKLPNFHLQIYDFPYSNRKTTVLFKAQHILRRTHNVIKSKNLSLKSLSCVKNMGILFNIVLPSQNIQTIDIP